jgi:hypothetical protein
VALGFNARETLSKTRNALRLDLAAQFQALLSELVEQIAKVHAVPLAEESTKH